MDDRVPARPHVVAMPYPGRGHINPMLTISRLLAARGLLVTFVVTEEWLGLLASSLEPPPPPTVAFRTIPNVIPSEHSRAADHSAFLEAVFTRMEEPFEQLLHTLGPKKVSAVIADTFLPWAVPVGKRLGVPVCLLFTMSASLFSVLYHSDRIFGSGDGRSGDPTDIDKQLEHYVPGSNQAGLSSVWAARKPFKWGVEAISWVQKAHCLLLASFYELEAGVIDILHSELPCPVYPIGPSIPYMLLEEKPSEPIGNNDSINLFTWLDSQPENSVLYVSLGSFLSVSGSQTDEIAVGLHDSGIGFLWVARGDSSHIQEMTGDKGLVVPWCDQLKVLSHPSVGGFLTHCGWNSTLEGMFAGLPMLTLPIFWDQPLNSKLVVDVWKVGLAVREEAGKGNLLGREDVAKVVKRLMDLNGVESREMRGRARELQEASHRAIKEGGSSYTSLSAFIKDLRQGCDC